MARCPLPGGMTCINNRGAIDLPLMFFIFLPLFSLHTLIFSLAISKIKYILPLLFTLILVFVFFIVIFFLECSLKFFFDFVHEHFVSFN
jgi:hypothetical protein